VGEAVPRRFRSAAPAANLAACPVGGHNRHMVRLVRWAGTVGDFEERNSEYISALRYAGHEPEVELSIEFRAMGDSRNAERVFVFCRRCQKRAIALLPWSWQRLSPERPCRGEP
jgi:hypothetical protein